MIFSFVFFLCMILYRTNSNIRIRILVVYCWQTSKPNCKESQPCNLLSLHTLFSQTSMCANARENAQSKLVNPGQFLCEICLTRRAQGASQYQSNARYSVATTKSLARQDTSICPSTKSQTNNFARSRFKKQAHIRESSKQTDGTHLALKEEARASRGLYATTNIDIFRGFAEASELKPGKFGGKRGCSGALL
jgi:hypothetical protein